MIKNNLTKQLKNTRRVISKKSKRSLASQSNIEYNEYEEESEEIPNAATIEAFKEIEEWKRDPIGHRNAKVYANYNDFVEEIKARMASGEFDDV